MKTDLFPSCGHCWVFQISWHIECSTFRAFCFLRPTWLHIPGCLALGEWSHHHGYLGHADLFFFSSSEYFCHLFLIISSASVSSIPFLSFIVPIFAWNVPLVSLIFLKRSLVFPLLLFSSISLHWSLRKLITCTYLITYFSLPSAKIVIVLLIVVYYLSGLFLNCWEKKRAHINVL